MCCPLWSFILSLSIPMIISRWIWSLSSPIIGQRSKCQKLHLFCGLLDKPGNESPVPHKRLPQAKVDVQVLQAGSIGRVVTADKHHALLIPHRHKAQSEDIPGSAGVALQGGLPQWVLLVQQALPHLGFHLAAQTCQHSDASHSSTDRPRYQC